MILSAVELQKNIEIALLASRKASEAIMKIYGSGNLEPAIKSDKTPVTIADQLSHNIIESHLVKTHLPILCEEGKNIEFEIRKNWEYFWLVDPLDGTKEFISKSGEFTVNIALIHYDTPVWGVVSAPVKNTYYYIGSDKNVWIEENGKKNKLLKKKSNSNKAAIRVVVSKSHLDKKTLAFIKTFDKPEIVSMGSSLKFMMLAEGKADIYPRFAPTMEWDTAASHAILNALDWRVNKENSKTPLHYNKPELVNSGFIVE